MPAERVTQARPFQVVGLDYTGGLQVRTDGKLSKVYICLFTCAVSRAVHLEIVEDLSEQEFLRAFIMFVSRRGLPEIVISDNASTFVASSTTLKALSRSDAIRNYMYSNCIEWKFITKRAPWVGGFYERLIGLTKSSLKKTLGKSMVTLRELRRIVTEIEAILNDRPITFVSSDVNDTIPLTPSHLIFGHRLDSLPTQIGWELFEDPTYGERPLITGSFARCSRILQDFWKRWRTEYLAALRERHSYINTSSNTEVRVGQVVLIHEDLPRVRWKLGVIVELLKCRDGIVRSVNLRSNNCIVNRPICKLYPLEVFSEEVVSQREEIAVNVRDLPKRKAAEAALRKIRNSTKM